MKLHVNGKMAERERDRKREREIDRKKKEQESAEAISGLKIQNVPVVLNPVFLYNPDRENNRKDVLMNRK